MTPRQRTLQFNGFCTTCRQPLPAGTTAFWDPVTKVTCLSCGEGAPPAAVHQAPSRPAVRPVTGSGVDRPAPGVDPRWDELVRYQLACVRRASAAQPVALSDAGAWVALDRSTARVLTGEVDEFAVSDALRARAAGGQDAGAVFLGWPVVVVPDSRRVLRAAPLLMIQLELPEGATHAVPADDQPRWNTALLSAEFFPPDVVAAAMAVVAAGSAFDDLNALTGQVRDVLDALGLDAQVVERPQPSGSPGVPGPGVHDVAMAFRGTSDVMTRGLVEELTTLRSRQDWGSTAARYLLDQAVPPALDALPAAAAPLTLNDSQEQALVASGTAAVTAVTGPPGTGKSQLVAAIVAGAWLRGETVLVASTNNQAVAAAVQKAHGVDEGSLVRTGNRELRDALPAALRELAARPEFTGPSAQVARRRLDLAIERRAVLHARLADRAALEGELAQLAVDLEVQRTSLWGASTESPVHDQREELAARARRVERAWWFATFRQRRVLEAARLPAGSAVTVTDLAEWAEAELRWDDAHRILAAAGPRDEEAERTELAAADREWAEAGRDAVQRAVSARLTTGRTALQQLADIRPGARARTAAVARTLPHAAGWACTSLSAQPNFPLTAGLFDLLVVDEASQCSVADVLAMAYRAKRIVVVGDPNQLAPVVTLSKQDLAAVARSVGTDDDAMHRAHVSYGRDSAYAGFRARAAGPELLLAEHYRCHPEIAGYLNDTFYGGELRVLTDPTEAGAGLQGLHWVQVDGQTEPGPRSGAVNRAEADAVVRWVVEHPEETGTLGVVTPFTAQAALIGRGLEQALGKEQWEAREVVVGTAHKLQGGERDVVLFSTVLSTGANPRTAAWVEKERNLVNVAVSRAKRALVVVGDATALTQLPVPTLRALAAAARPDARVPTDDLREDPRLHSEAERRLFAALRAAGADVVPKHVVSGYELDFAVRQPDGRMVDVECDGTQHLDPRGRQRRQDLARDLVLRHLGWQVVRVPAWRCLTEPEQVAEEIAGV